MVKLSTLNYINNLIYLIEDYKYKKQYSFNEIKNLLQNEDKQIIELLYNEY